MDIHQSGVPHSEGAFTLDHRQALAVPIMSSIALLALFYFFKAIQLLLLLLICCASAVGIVFAAHPLFQLVAISKRSLGRRIILCSTWHVQVGEALLACFAGTAVFLWILTGSMALNNLLGICICISFVSFVRLPSLKITTMLLSALFFYDIFWVFFSERLFGKNVMVEAATKQADNPAVTVAEALHLPSSGLAQHLDLPVKLMFPANPLRWGPSEPVLMLGLGDIALPAMLISLLLCEDVAKWQQYSSSGVGIVGRNALRTWQFWRQSYVLPSWIGYAVGMFLALGMGSVYQAAQPALLYLVPCTLAPAVVLARRRRELRGLWEGWEIGRREGKATNV